MKTAIIVASIATNLCYNALRASETTTNENDNAFLNITGYASFDISSCYILYGARQTKEPCYWTYGELDFDFNNIATLGASLWQNTDMTCRRKNVMRRMNEWDYTIYIRKSFIFTDDFSLATEFGNVWYKFHGLENHEIRKIYLTMMCAYMRFTLENPYLTPYFYAAYDWKATESTFLQIGLKHTFQLPLNISFTPEFVIGAGDNRYLSVLYPPWDKEKVSGGVSYVEALGRLDYQITNSLGVHAILGYSVIANSHIRQGIDDETSDYSKQFVWGSIGIDFAF